GELLRLLLVRRRGGILLFRRGLRILRGGRYGLRGLVGVLWRGLRGLRTRRPGREQRHRDRKRQQAQLAGVARMRMHGWLLHFGISPVSSECPVDATLLPCVAGSCAIAR